MFGGEDLTGHGMDGEAMLVAVTVAVDGGVGARLADEGIVGRNRPVVIEPQHLAIEGLEVLGLIVERTSGGYPDLAILAELDTRGGGPGGPGLHERRHAGQAAILEFAALERQKGPVCRPVH